MVPLPLCPCFEHNRRLADGKGPALPDQKRIMLCSVREPCEAVGTINPGPPPPACRLSAHASPGQKIWGRVLRLLQGAELERRAEGRPPAHVPFTQDEQGFLFRDLDSKRGIIGTQMLYISGKTMKPGPAAATDLLCGRSGCSGCKAGLRCRSWHQTFASGNSHTSPACQ